MALNPKQQRFIDEYTLDANASRAYGVAYGVTGQQTGPSGYRLLKNAYVAAELAARRAAINEANQANAKALVDRLWDIFTADPRELTENRVGCCRHCYGTEHRFQHTVGEIAAFEEECYEKKRKRMPDIRGGTGFDPRKPPVDDCPECAGVGLTRVVVKDSRNYSPKAAALFAGIKQTKDGMQVLMHSQLDAAEKLAKHLGIYAEDNRQKESELSTAMAGLIKGIHDSGVGRIPFKPRKAIEVTGNVKHVVLPADSKQP